MSTLMQRSSRQTAEQQVMSDLMNSLLAEQLLPLRSHSFIDFDAAPAQLWQLYQGYEAYSRKNGEHHSIAINTSGNNFDNNNSNNNSINKVDSARDTSAVTLPFSLGLHTEGVLCLVENGVRQGIQWVQGSPIYQQGPDGSWMLLDTPAAVGRAVLQHALSKDAYAQPGVADFLASLDLAVEQYALGWHQIQTLSTYHPKSAYEWFVKSERIAAPGSPVPPFFQSKGWIQRRRC